MLTWSLLSVTAQANPTDFSRVVDPYELHVQQLEELLVPQFTVADPDDLVATGTPTEFAAADTQTQATTSSDVDGFMIIRRTPQIDEGVVTLTSFGQDVGTIWGEAIEPDLDVEFHREHWVIHDAGFASDPGAPFTLEMEDPKAPASEAIPYMANGWQDDPYAAIDFQYTGQPSSTVTNAMTYGGPKVERHLFMLIQSESNTCANVDDEEWVSQVTPSCRAGVMLRERHLNNKGGTKRFVEHWLFYGNFSMLDEEHEKLRVVAIKSKPPKNAAVFFTTYGGSQVDFYAQAKYNYVADASDFPGSE